MECSSTPTNLTLVTEHILPCEDRPKCKRRVKPVVPDALPRCMIGDNVVGVTSWFHCGLGITIEQLVAILAWHPQIKFSPGVLRLLAAHDHATTDNPAG